MEQAENVQQPKHNRDYDDAIENGLDGTLHGDETIHQP
jgi:hypothetical protein